MNIASLSIAMSQSKLQQASSIALMKIAMNTGKETADQMTEMLKSAAIDPNLGKHLDVNV